MKRIFLLLGSSLIVCHSSMAATISCETVFSSNPHNIPHAKSEKVLSFGSAMTRVFSRARQIMSRFSQPSTLDLIQDYFSKTTRPEIKISSVLGAYSKDPNFGVMLRASKDVRIQNAKQLNVNVEKFKNLSNDQLAAQWGAQRLTLQTTSRMETLGKVTGLTRGEHVRLTRTFKISRQDLLELIETRKVTSRILHIFNYDLSSLRVFHQKYGSNNLAEILRYQRSHGGSAISTTYAVDGYGKTRLNRPVIDENGLFSIQLEFLVPAEAFVFRTRDFDLPEHVRKSPWGFCIVTHNEHREGEGMFVDFIPPEWLVSDLEGLSSYLNN